MRRATAAVVAVMWTAACVSGGPPRLEVAGEVVAGESVLPADEASEQRARPATVASGALVTARYQIRNAGGRDLLLHGLALPCGCRLASSLPDALAPGEDAPVSVRCRAPRTPGDVVREILLRSSDPARPEERLRVRMAVAAGSAADPPALYFGYVPVGGSAGRELVVALGKAGSPSASPALPTAADPALAVEPRPARADGRRVYLIRFAPRAPGVLRTVLTLAAGDEVPVIGVGFQGLVAFPAEVRPSGVMPTGAGFAITLKGVGDEPLEITGVELPPDLAGELVPAASGREWRLAVRARGPRTSEGPPIRVYANAAAEPALEIPVRPDVP